MYDQAATMLYFFLMVLWPFILTLVIGGFALLALGVIRIVTFHTDRRYQRQSLLYRGWR